jgi:hypothetical protein
LVVSARVAALRETRRRFLAPWSRRYHAMDWPMPVRPPTIR